MARDITPHVISLANSIINELSPNDSEKAKKIIDKLKFWHGEMHETSIGATIFSVWQLKFYETLFLNYFQTE